MRFPGGKISRWLSVYSYCKKCPSKCFMIFAKDKIKTVDVISAIFGLKNTIPPKHNTLFTVYSSSSSDFTVNNKAFLGFQKNVTQRSIFIWRDLNYSTVFKIQSGTNQEQYDFDSSAFSSMSCCKHFGIIHFLHHAVRKYNLLSQQAS